MKKILAFFFNGLIQISFAFGFVSTLIATAVQMRIGNNVLCEMWIGTGILFMTYSLMRGYLATKSPWYNVMNRVHRFDKKYLLGRDDRPQLDVTVFVKTMKTVLACAWMIFALTSIGSVITFERSKAASSREAQTQPPYVTPYYVDYSQMDGGVRELAKVTELPSAIPGSNIGFLRVRSTSRNMTFTIPVGLPCNLEVGSPVQVRLLNHMQWSASDSNGRIFDRNFEAIRVLDLPSGSVCTFEPAPTETSAN